MNMRFRRKKSAHSKPKSQRKQTTSNEPSKLESFMIKTLCDAIAHKRDKHLFRPIWIYFFLVWHIERYYSRQIRRI